jgi:lysine 2,3-aminomutase
VAGPSEIARAVCNNRGVREVILSGGEPLLLSDRALDQRLRAARSRSRVDLVRIHSRIPCTLPARITPGLLRTLGRHRPLWFVTHFNHEKELSSQARRALLRVGEAGIPLLNQAVLLRGVNDSVAAQAALGRALAACGVKPHYLFQLDRAAGTLHFQVPMRRALDLITRLRARHSGLLVPHLLVDLPGRDGKVPITPGAVLKITDRGTWLKTPPGKKVWYQG